MITKAKNQIALHHYEHEIRATHAVDQILKRGSEGETVLKTHIGGIADDLTKENLLVAIESVDDETEQLVDLRLECKRLRLRHFRTQRKLTRLRRDLGFRCGAGI